MTISHVLRRTAIVLSLVLILAACGSDPVGVEAADGPAAPGAEGEAASGTQPVATTEPVEAPEVADADDTESDTDGDASSGSDSAEAEPPRAEDAMAEEPGEEDPETVRPGDDGSDPVVDSPPAESSGDEPLLNPEDGSAAPPSPAQPPVISDGWIRTTSAPDMLSPSSAQPEELFASADGMSIVVRYFNGAEPCSLARVTVAESADVVEVTLETGIHPNAAAMSCIAIVSGYEIVVPLTAPIGSRELVAARWAPSGSGGPDEPGVSPGDGEVPPDESGAPIDAVFATDYYIGLTIEEAQALADVEQRPLRISSRDGEPLPGTADYLPERVNVEVEAGVVVGALGG